MAVGMEHRRLERERKERIGNISKVEGDIRDLLRLSSDTGQIGSY